MKGLSLPKNKKNIANVCLNIGAIIILNAVIQFALYPSFEKTLGAETYGVILSLISLISITANSVGSAANYSRLVQQQKLEPHNGDYNLLLLIGGIICSIIGTIYIISLKIVNVWVILLYCALTLLTTFRYYSDVEFKFNKNFTKFFFFYLAISVGYIIGIFLFKLTGQWTLAILLGEALGIIFSIFASDIYKKTFKPSKAFKPVLASIGLLLLSLLFENLALNADRLLLLAIEGGESVSIYYVASIIGKIIALLTVPLNSIIISYLVHYEKPLSTKLWSLFVLLCIGCCVIVFFGGLLASNILLPVLYADMMALVKPYIIPALVTQIFYFLSGVLLVVLLRYYGEKNQFFVNLGYVVIFFIATIFSTLKWGLNGFVYSAMIVNIIRFIFVMIWGFIPNKKQIISLKN